jgi:hypothetical protein
MDTVKMKFVSGESVEDRFHSVDRVLQHFSKRLHKTVVGVIPPTLTYNYVDTVPEDGIILRAILPAGRLVLGFMFVEEYEGKDAVNFIAKLEGPKSSQSKVFETRKRLVTIEPDMEVSLGDRLTFQVVERERVRKIWIGFLFHVQERYQIHETFMIDKLEQLAGGSDEH